MNLSNRYRLKYVDADDLDDTPFDFDGIKVTNAQDEDLGEVDGFIVDVANGRPYYVVVDAGGWFKSKHYLLPIGHARLDEAKERLMADITRTTVERYPGFDRDHFEKLSDADLDRLNRDTAVACCESEAASEIGAASTSAEQSWSDRWSHYRQPDWWKPSHVGSTASAAPGAAHAPDASRARDRRPGAEHVVARERERNSARDGLGAFGETSPYPGGRAEPGDVVGIDTGGEQTHIGDTAEDENKRRRDAEKDAAKKSRD